MFRETHFCFSYFKTFISVLCLKSHKSNLFLENPVSSWIKAYSIYSLARFDVISAIFSSDTFTTIFGWSRVLYISICYNVIYKIIKGVSGRFLEFLSQMLFDLYTYKIGIWKYSEKSPKIVDILLSPFNSPSKRMIYPSFFLHTIALFGSLCISFLSSRIFTKLSHSALVRWNVSVASFKEIPSFFLAKL